MGGSLSVTATATTPAAALQSLPQKSAREVFALENTCSTASAARCDDLDAVESTRDGAESSKDGVESTRDGAESAKDAMESSVGMDLEPQDTLCVADAVESSVGVELEPLDTICVLGAASSDGQDPSEDGVESTADAVESSVGSEFELQDASNDVVESTKACVDANHTAQLELPDSDGQESVESTDDAVESSVGTVCELQEEPSTDVEAPMQEGTVDCADAGTATGGDGQMPADGLTMTFSTSETLLIFDWDDTIMPTTWLAEEDLVREDVELNEEQQAVLQRIEDNAKALLNKAKAYGKVLIITNAADGWVEESVRLFIPGLQPVLQQGVRVVSARATFHEQSRPDACGFPFAWKVKAFRAEADAYFGEQPEGSRRNIVCCGDSMDEYKACQRLERSMPECRAKFVKFLPLPAPAELAAELESLYAALGEVINHDGTEQYDLGA